MGCAAQRQQLQPRVDRREEPPFLLRVFYRLDAQHSLEEFKVRGEEPVQDELQVRLAVAPGKKPSETFLGAAGHLGEWHVGDQVYAWMDSRLRDICHLIKDVCAEARDRGAVWHFRLVYPGKHKRLFSLCMRMRFGRHRSRLLPHSLGASLCVCGFVYLLRPRRQKRLC